MESKDLLPSIVFLVLLPFIITLETESSNIAFECRLKQGKGVSVRSPMKVADIGSIDKCRDACIAKKTEMEALKTHERHEGTKLDGMTYSSNGGCECQFEMRDIDDSEENKDLTSCHLVEIETNVMNGKSDKNNKQPEVDLSYNYFKDLSCDETWTKIGCSSVKSKFSRGRLLVDYRYNIEWEKDRFPKFSHSLVCACASAARIIKARYFATHFWGECWELQKDDINEPSTEGCVLADGLYNTTCNGLSQGGECIGTTSYYVYSNLPLDEDERKRQLKRGIPKRDV